MTIVTVLERPDGGRLQVAAGPSDLGGALRHLMFSVPDTNDSARLDWGDAAAFAAAGTLPVILRIGTLAPQQAVMTQSALANHEPPDEAAVRDPSSKAILHALADAFLPFVLAHSPALTYLEGKVPKWHWVLQGKVPKSPATRLVEAGPAAAETTHDAMTDLDAVVAQHAAAGSSLGTLITGSADGAAIGAAIGAAVGLAEYLTG